jgi:hypothetical protein
VLACLGRRPKRKRKNDGTDKKMWVIKAFIKYTIELLKTSQQKDVNTNKPSKTEKIAPKPLWKLRRGFFLLERIEGNE